MPVTEQDLREYVLPRMGRRDLVFHGVLLGEASSHQHGALRWFEVSIFSTERGRYVVAGVGRTIVPGEADRPWVNSVDTADEVVRRLMRVDHHGERYLTRTSVTALSRAALVDPSFAEALVAWAV